MAAIALDRRRTGPLAFTYHNIECSPREPGVYEFWFRRRCLYVGQSKDVRGRLLQHWNASHNADLRLWIEAYGKDLSFEYSICPFDHRQQEERRRILKLRPEVNIALTELRKGDS